jgi:pyruvate dehydrogenase E2 component (dihydrolipoamide acetyltransferase)
VRKLGREQGIDLTRIAGSGPGGRIIARDLETALRAPALPPALPAPLPVHARGLRGDEPRYAPEPPVLPGELALPEARPLSMMRKAIARRLTESKQTVPHFYLSVDVDADPLHALREQLNADLAATAPEGQPAPKVSFNDLLIKACALALRRVPECNAQFTPDAILIHRRVDISVAVAVPEGLMTPVVRNADRKTVLEIAAEVRELAARARAKKLRPEEMADGTFSISNLGMYGIDDFAAVINPPEGAILAVGQVRREPVVRGDQIVPGRRMAMTLSCDHRVVDGAVGATFLKALRLLLDHPTQILLG